MIHQLNFDGYMILIDLSMPLLLDMVVSCAYHRKAIYNSELKKSLNRRSCQQSKQTESKSHRSVNSRAMGQHQHAVCVQTLIWEN